MIKVDQPEIIDQRLYERKIKYNIIPLPNIATTNKINLILYSLLVTKERVIMIFVWFVAFYVIV